MTNNNALKKKAREHAERTGVPYAQARREVIAMHEASADRVVREQPFETTTVSWVTLQQKVRPDGGTPLPLTIDQHGYLGNQDFWRGNMWRLIGFTADPDVNEIHLQREEFLAEPDRAVGMHPVFMDRQRKWATWNGAVETVRTQEMTAADPREVRAEFYGRSPAGEQFLSIGVGHVLKALTAAEVAEMVSVEMASGPVVDDLLSVLCMTGDSRALDFSAIFDDVEDEDLVLQVALEVAEVDAWMSSGRGYRHA